MAMTKPIPSEYRGSTSISDIIGTIYLVADTQILEIAYDRGLDDIIEEYTHLIEHVIYQDIKGAVPTRKWSQLEKDYKELIDSEVGSDEWYEAISSLNGYALGLTAWIIRESNE